MDLLQSQNHKINPSKQNHNEKKTRLTHDQVRLLERSFISNKKLEPERKDQLAKALGIPPRQVAVWYQNKRARWRTQSLELDCSVLQVRLENALAEKSEVEREVVRLRGELKKAKEMLGQVALEYKKPTPPPFSTTNTTTFSISSWCEEEMIRRSSTSFSNNYYDQDHDDHVIMDGQDQVLQLDRELLACLIGSDDDRVVDDDLL